MENGGWRFPTERYRKVEDRIRTRERLMARLEAFQEKLVLFAHAGRIYDSPVTSIRRIERGRRTRSRGRPKTDTCGMES
jgi:hypothetical protein